MTLVLAWKVKRAIVVIADTHFSSSGITASEIGPKIFTIPISVTGLIADATISLAPMGFAFAGDSGSGQFTHALATACLGQLCGPTIGQRPSVHDVASFYASCATRLVNERRRHQAFDRFTFEGIIFGQRHTSGHAGNDAEACHFIVSIDQNGKCVSTVAPIDFNADPVFVMGSGAPRAQSLLASLADKSPSAAAVEAIDKIITAREEMSVGGCIQGAVATVKGAEIRPVLRHGEREDEYYGLMGISVLKLGTVAGYVPMGTPLMLDLLANNSNHTLE